MRIGVLSDHVRVDRVDHANRETGFSERAYRMIENGTTRDELNEDV